MWNGTGYYIPAHYTSAYLHTYLLYDQSCIQFFDTGRGVQRGERKERNFKSVCVSCVRPSVRVSACFPSLSRVVFSSSRLLMASMASMMWCYHHRRSDESLIEGKGLVYLILCTYLPTCMDGMYVHARGTWWYGCNFFSFSNLYYARPRALALMC